MAGFTRKLTGASKVFIVSDFSSMRMFPCPIRFAHICTSTNDLMVPAKEETILPPVDLEGNLLRRRLVEFSQNKPLPPARVISWDKVKRIKRHVEIWADKESVVHRLPEHYKQRYWENLLRDRTPVHYKRPERRFDFDEKKNIPIEREDYPIVPIYPPEADTGLWGGEGVLKGYKLSRPKKRKKILPRHWVPEFWWPDLKEDVLYSETLDRYMKIIVTERTLLLIDQHFGLDFYILRTPESDLCSKLGNKLKREMLLALAKGLPHISDETKRETLRKRYKEFIIPQGEAEWVGLDLNEACVKLQEIEEMETEKKSVPKKVLLEEDQLKKIKEEGSEKVGWLEPWKRW